MEAPAPRAPVRAEFSTRLPLPLPRGYFDHLLSPPSPDERKSEPDEVLLTQELMLRACALMESGPVAMLQRGNGAAPTVPDAACHAPSSSRSSPSPSCLSSSLCSTSGCTGCTSPAAVEARALPSPSAAPPQTSSQPPPCPCGLDNYSPLQDRFNGPLQAMLQRPALSFNRAAVWEQFAALRQRLVEEGAFVAAAAIAVTCLARGDPAYAAVLPPSGAVVSSSSSSTSSRPCEGRSAPPTREELEGMFVEVGEGALLVTRQALFTRVWSDGTAARAFLSLYQRIWRSIFLFRIDGVFVPATVAFNIQGVTVTVTALPPIYIHWHPPLRNVLVSGGAADASSSSCSGASALANAAARLRVVAQLDPTSLDVFLGVDGRGYLMRPRNSSSGTIADCRYGPGVPWRPELHSEYLIRTATWRSERATAKEEEEAAAGLANPASDAGEPTPCTFLRTSSGRPAWVDPRSGARSSGAGDALTFSEADLGEFLAAEGIPKAASRLTSWFLKRDSSVAAVHREEGGAAAEPAPLSSLSGHELVDVAVSEGLVAATLHAAGVNCCCLFGVLRHVECIAQEEGGSSADEGSRKRRDDDDGCAHAKSSGGEFAGYDVVQVARACRACSLLLVVEMVGRTLKELIKLDLARGAGRVAPTEASHGGAEESSGRWAEGERRLDVVNRVARLFASGDPVFLSEALEPRLRAKFSLTPRAHAVPDWTALPIGTTLKVVSVGIGVIFEPAKGRFARFAVIASKKLAMLEPPRYVHAMLARRERETQDEVRHLWALADRVGQRSPLFHLFLHSAMAASCITNILKQKIDAFRDIPDSLPTILRVDVAMCVAAVDAPQRNAKTIGTLTNLLKLLSDLSAELRSELRCFAHSAEALDGVITSTKLLHACALLEAAKQQPDVGLYAKAIHDLIDAPHVDPAFCLVHQEALRDLEALVPLLSGGDIELFIDAVVEPVARKLRRCGRAMHSARYMQRCLAAMVDAPAAEHLPKSLGLAQRSLAAATRLGGTFDDPHSHHSLFLLAVFALTAATPFTPSRRPRAAVVLSGARKVLKRAQALPTSAACVAFAHTAAVVRVLVAVQELVEDSALQGNSDAVAATLPRMIRRRIAKLVVFANAVATVQRWGRGMRTRCGVAHIGIERVRQQRAEALRYARPPTPSFAHGWKRVAHVSPSRPEEAVQRSGSTPNLATASPGAELLRPPREHSRESERLTGSRGLAFQQTLPGEVRGPPNPDEHDGTRLTQGSSASSPLVSASPSASAGASPPEPSLALSSPAIRVAPPPSSAAPASREEAQLGASGAAVGGGGAAQAPTHQSPLKATPRLPLRHPEQQAAEEGVEEEAALRALAPGARDLFRTCDARGDGRVAPEACVAVLAKLGVLEEKQLRNIFHAATRRSSGEALTPREFASVLRRAGLDL